MNESYIMNKYGITLAERDEIMKYQDYKCPGCGRDLRECRPEVDHEHITMKMIDVVLVKGSVFEQIGFTDKWIASVIVGGKRITARAQTKTAVIKLVKQAAKRPSVRGICCGGRYAGCNRKMGRLDNIPWLENTVKYLKSPPARTVLSVVSVKTEIEK